MRHQNARAKLTIFIYCCQIHHLLVSAREMCNVIRFSLALETSAMKKTKYLYSNKAVMFWTWDQICTSFPAASAKKPRFSVHDCLFRQVDFHFQLVSLCINPDPFRVIFVFHPRASHYQGQLPSLLVYLNGCVEVPTGKLLSLKRRRVLCCHPRWASTGGIVS